MEEAWLLDQLEVEVAMGAVAALQLPLSSSRTGGDWVTAMKALERQLRNITSIEIVKVELKLSECGFGSAYRLVWMLICHDS